MLGWVLLLALAVAQTQAQIDVVATTPIDGTGVERDKYPANVQRIRTRDDHPVSDALTRGAANVQTSEAQGTAMQPDLGLRGFTGSPLLGSAEGLAIFQDGVRLNEPFGDVVHWDTIPEGAVASMEAIPGSNAAFGLNALGGVIALRTKSGYSDPGLDANASFGSFGHRRAGFAQGWANLFVDAEHEAEDGWRDFSPSRRNLGFVSLSLPRLRSASDVRLSVADTNLSGNGAAPMQLLDEDRNAVFTHRDVTRNRTAFLSSAHSFVTNAVTFELTAAARRTRTRTENGDETPYEACGNFLCTDDDEPVVDAHGDPIPFADAVLNQSDTKQTALSLAAQFTTMQTVGGGNNRLTVGVSGDRGDARFAFDAEIANLDATRKAVGIGLIAEDSRVGLDATTSTGSLYLADVFTPSAKLTIVATARANRSTVRLEDRIGDELDGDHHFTSVNPSIGVVYRGLFANVSQSSRTPTPVELTCADPDAPCRLPNAFVSDPPLQQVFARTIEAGGRGRYRSLRWTAAAFRTRNENDILFISSGRARGSGNFQNVGATERRGLELNAEGVYWFASYALLDATFQEHFTAASPRHPRADEGAIDVEPGDRLPLLPRHTFKAGASFSPIAALRIDVAARVESSRFYRGDEANLAHALPGFAVADIDLRYRLGARVALIASATNVTNRRYATFGTFGDATEVLGDRYDDPRFVSPAQPRAIRVGISIAR
ncbi:MAG: TonB-dependent receptor [Acidobacteria bacterium]|nr:TonB-dependent receptor [Acidobacteriota bacterium]